VLKNTHEYVQYCNIKIRLGSFYFNVTSFIPRLVPFFITFHMLIGEAKLMNTKEVENGITHLPLRPARFSALVLSIRDSASDLSMF
jgi:hypothetical protein